jgi:hypothetical protein
MTQEWGVEFPWTFRASDMLNEAELEEETAWSSDKFVACGKSQFDDETATRTDSKFFMNVLRN